MRFYSREFNTTRKQAVSVHWAKGKSLVEFPSAGLSLSGGCPITLTNWMHKCSQMICAHCCSCVVFCSAGSVGHHSPQHIASGQSNHWAEKWRRTIVPNTWLLLCNLICTTTLELELQLLWLWRHSMVIYTVCGGVFSSLSLYCCYLPNLRGFFLLLRSLSSVLFYLHSVETHQHQHKILSKNENETITETTRMETTSENFKTYIQWRREKGRKIRLSSWLDNFPFDFV